MQSVLCRLLVAVAGAAAAAPRVHFTPDCYRAAGPHDIAAAVWSGELWHLMAGCWSTGGWQHLTSPDLVRWTAVGKPTGFGGTGGLVLDEQGRMVAYAMAGGAIEFWVATDPTGTGWQKQETRVPSCCNDPVVWRDAGRWYAITAAHGRGGKNFGLESFYTSPALVGPAANWTALPDFFENQRSLVVPGHPQQKEFVSPDYFSNIPGALSPAASVFMTSTYGPLGPGLKGFYNYAVFLPGSQPAGPGTVFAPNVSLETAVDWSCFAPDNSTAGGLGLALEYGPTQFGCCPKTAAGKYLSDDRPPRRVMFGWLQNGNSDGAADNNATENTLTLPRDISISPQGAIQQAFVPELHRLRVAGSHWHAANLSFPSSGGLARPAMLPVRSIQAELLLKIQYPAAADEFGLLLFTGSGEFTAVAFNPAGGTVAVDRRKSSGGAQDADIRAGRWTGAQAAGGEVSVHVYIDRSIVTLIAANQTGLSVWVHPRADSAGLGIYANGPGIVLVSCDVWQLGDA